jgi:hypothetical protein
MQQVRECAASLISAHGQQVPVHVMITAHTAYTAGLICTEINSVHMHGSALLLAVPLLLCTERPSPLVLVPSAIIVASNLI